MKRRLTALLGVCLFGMLTLAGCTGGGTSAAAPASAGPRKVAPAGTSGSPQAGGPSAGGSAPTETVMTIGSSVAAGWGDAPGKGGYLARAFRQLSAAGPTQYRVVSDAYGGVTGTEIAPQYPRWLARVKPNIVVISWGGMDDLTNHTSLPDFRAVVRREIRLALAAGAAVFIVTPPVTPAAYLNGLNALPYLYFTAEMNVAQSLHNPNVYVFDVFDQMLAYMKQHNRPYTDYMADGWHANAAGNELAGNLLLGDMQAVFGNQPVTVHPTSAAGGAPPEKAAARR